MGISVSQSQGAYRVIPLTKKPYKGTQSNRERSAMQTVTAQQLSIPKPLSNPLPNQAKPYKQRNSNLSRNIKMKTSENRQQYEIDEGDYKNIGNGIEHQIRELQNTKQTKRNQSLQVRNSSRLSNENTVIVNSERAKKLKNRKK